MALALPDALALHDRAVRALLQAVDGVPSARWQEPVEAGKWSSAQILEHLIATYDIVLGELAGGEGMRIRTGLWQRLLLRLTILPRIMRGRGFPKGAPAPREIRPGTGVDRDQGVSRFEERSKQFEFAAQNASPQQKLTHAYFGSSTVANGVLLVARHIEHHTRQLPKQASKVG